MKSVSELIGKMMGENMLRINERWVWSWGNRDYCYPIYNISLLHLYMCIYRGIAAPY